MNTIISGDQDSKNTAPRTQFEIQKILVPLDFSDPAEQALRYAVIFAAKLNGKITPFHVIEPGPLLDDASGIDDGTNPILRRAAERLSMQASRHGDPKLFDTAQVRVGRPPHQIGLAASELGSELIVISTQGYTGLDYVLLGGTAERVIREAPCAVLVVRRVITPLSEPKSILVPVDFSPASLNGLRYALGLAHRMGARITVVHVVEPPGPMARLEVDAGAYVRKLCEGARFRLSALHLDVDEPVSGFDTVVRSGLSYHETVDLAREGAFDLIVMASLGRSGIADRLLGSTAERVVRHAPCPVLVVRGRAFAGQQTAQ
ncbi:MAG: universal stress protein [Chthoniobacter sp.]|nr:universal stress protein [Chthoniobacter sp.]